MAALLLQYSAQNQNQNPCVAWWLIWTSGGAFSLRRRPGPGCSAVTLDPGSGDSLTQSKRFLSHFLGFDMIFKNRFVASANQRAHRSQLTS